MAPIVKRTVIVFLLSLGFVFGQGNSSFGQEAPPVEWSCLVTPQPEIDKGAVELRFIGVIPEGCHVYSNDFACEFGPLPSEFKFTENKSYKLIGKAEAIGAKKSYDDIFECEISDFSDTAVFRQMVQLASDVSEVQGTLEYQMCLPNGMCILRKYEFNVKP